MTARSPRRRTRRPRGRHARRARRCARERRPVPDPHPQARSRSSTRRACRSSSTTPTRSSRRSGIDFRGDPDALATAAATPAPTSRASASGSRAACAARSSRRPRRGSSPSTRATRADRRRSATRTRSSRPNYGSPFVRDLDNGRRYGTIEDFRNFVKLTYMTPHLHHSGGTVCEPVDVPVNKRHLDMVYSHIRYSDKPFMGSVTHPDRARDTVEMARIAFGDRSYLDDAHGHPQPRSTPTRRSSGTRRCSAPRASTPRRTRRRSSRRSSSPARCRR